MEVHATTPQRMAEMRRRTHLVALRHHGRVTVSTDSSATALRVAALKMEREGLLVHQETDLEASVDIWVAGPELTE